MGEDGGKIDSSSVLEGKPFTQKLFLVKNLTPCTMIWLIFVSL